MSVGVESVLDRDHPLGLVQVALLRFGDERIDVTLPVANDPQVRVVEDGGTRVRVDGKDRAGFLHALDVLDGAGDADGDVQLGTDRDAGLSDLTEARGPPLVGGGARRCDLAAECVGEFLQLLEALGASDTDAAGDEDLALRDVFLGLVECVLDEFRGVGLPGEPVGLHDLGLALALGVGGERFEDARASGGHLGAVAVAADGRQHLAAEGRSAGEKFAVDDVDVQLGAVGRHAGVDGCGDTAGDVAAGVRRSDEDDVGLAFQDEFVERVRGGAR